MKQKEYDKMMESLYKFNRKMIEALDMILTELLESLKEKLPLDANELRLNEKC